jgi:surface polysaccharide O-acyltransferase-like enzyme
VAYADWKIIKYFLIIWLIGTGVVPLIGLYTKISPAVNWFQQSIFVLTGLVGYFILGAYIYRLRFRRSTLAALLVIGAVSTGLGTYFLVSTMGENYSRILLDASSLTVIVTSIALFLLLASVPNQKVEKHTKISRILSVISQNTLPIYLFHVIVLETLQKGYLGVRLSVSTLNPIIEIPLLTAVTLLICLAIIVPLKKVPCLKRILG